MLLAGSGALELAAWFTISFVRIVYHLTDGGSCGAACALIRVESTTTHPYFYPGIALAASGVVLALLAFFLRRRDKGERGGLSVRQQSDS